MSTIQNISHHQPHRIFARPTKPVVQDNPNGDQPTPVARGPVERSIHLGRPEAPTLSPTPDILPDPEFATPITADPPDSAETDSADVRIQKVFDEVYAKFSQSDNTNEADLARALFFSILGIVQETAGSNSYVESATRVSGFLDQLHANNEPPSEPTQSVQSAGIATAAQAGVEIGEADDSNTTGRNPLNFLA